MRTIALVFGLCLFLNAPLQAQEDNAKVIITRAMTALGDAKVAAKLKTGTVKVKGTFRLTGITFDLNVQAWLQLPDKTKEVVTLSTDGAKIEIVEVINGEKGWRSLNGDIDDLDDDDMKEAKETMYVDMVTDLFGVTADKEIKLTALGDAKVGGSAVVGVKVTKKGKPDVSLYFDKKSNLLVKAEYRAYDHITEAEVAQVKLFGSYKEFVPGLKSASKITITNDGEPFMEFEITEIRPVERHEDGVFARPK